MEKMNGLDLFSGIGGIGLALNEWVRTVAYCEQDRYAQGVLLSRMQSGDIDTAPIWDDVRTLKRQVLPRIDIIFGGFPCQDISLAGLGAGLDGERSVLFFEIARLVGEIRPEFVFLENVPAITFRGLDRVLLEFAALGYDCRWTINSAASVGACHLRERWFLLAHARGERLQGLEHQESPPANTKNANLVLPEISDEFVRNNFRKDDGLPIPMGEIKCFGNTVVPLQVKTAFEYLMGINLTTNKENT